ncbi:MAG: tetratricopeptide repeat protein [Chthoniobacterales bacterium]
MVTPRSAQLVKDADARVSEGDYQHAVDLYETALDGTPGSAEIHYRLGLLYDDKLSDQLHALHHFKRYLTLAPTGPHAKDVNNFMKRDQLALVTSLSGDAVVPRAEAARLRNENLALRKQLDEARTHPTATAEGKAKKATKAARPRSTPSKRATRSHSQ